MELMVGTDQRLTVPDVARRLALPGPEVYLLIFEGVIPARLDDDGAVYVSARALDAYLGESGRHPPTGAG